MLSRSCLGRSDLPRLCDRFGLRCIASAPLYAIVFCLASFSVATAYENEVSTKANADKEERGNLGLTADELVQEALASEIYGEAETRERLLKAALQLDPDNELARWHLGYVKVRNEWMPTDAVKDLAIENRSLQAYEIRRKDAQDTVADQLELARWCQRRNLPDQQKAHLFRVLQLNPDHLTARNLLGFRMVEGEWVSNEDLEVAAEQQRADMMAFKEWRSPVADIAKNLGRENTEIRQTAFDRLRKINDPEAIPAMEAILSGMNEEVANAVVDTLELMPSKESSVSLARHAVFSPWDSVRESAAEALSEREKTEYVPQMLASLQAPIMTMEQLLPGRGERLIHRQVLVREGQENVNVQVQDSTLRRQMRVGDAEQTWRNALTNLDNEAANRNTQVQLENARTQQLNERICDALRVATEQPEMPSDPQTWWAWWNQDNDILLQGAKPVQTSYTQQDVVVQEGFQFGPDRVQMRQDLQQLQARQASQRHECLVRGTPIYTAKGLVAVESIQVGDMVLAKDIETGELGLRSVLRTTVRPSGKTMQIEAGEEVFRSSLGHPFWVSGEGWVQAKDLQSGMELHTLHGTIRISQVTESAPEETYNLVVDDFATYFVGESQVLSHDHTFPSPTDRVVPGLED